MMSNRVSRSRFDARFFFCTCFKNASIICLCPSVKLDAPPLRGDHVSIACYIDSPVGLEAHSRAPLVLHLELIDETAIRSENDLHDRWPLIEEF